MTSCRDCPFTENRHARAQKRRRCIKEKYSAKATERRIAACLTVLFLICFRYTAEGIGDALFPTVTTGTQAVRLIAFGLTVDFISCVILAAGFGAVLSLTEIGSSDTDDVKRGAFATLPILGKLWLMSVVFALMPHLAGDNAFWASAIVAAVVLIGDTPRFAVPYLVFKHKLDTKTAKRISRALADQGKGDIFRFYIGEIPTALLDLATFLLSLTVTAPRTAARYLALCDELYEKCIIITSHEGENYG